MVTSHRNMPVYMNSNYKRTVIVNYLQDLNTVLLCFVAIMICAIE